MSLKSVFLAALMVAPVFASELPKPLEARLLQVISKGCGEGGRANIKDSEVASEFQKVGGTVDSSSKLVWVSTIEEARMQSMQRKLTVGGDPKMSSFCAVIIHETGGKPQIILNPKLVQASGLTLSDALIKAAAQ